ncbi:hypothetical protein ACHAQJ_001323 [Trichoderma viride]
MAELGWAHAKRSLAVFNVTLRYVQSAASGTLESSALDPQSMHTKSFINGDSVAPATDTNMLSSETLPNPLPQSSPSLDQGSLFTPMSPALSNDQFMTILGIENFVFEPPPDDGGIQTPNMALNITDWSSWEAFIPNWESIFT